MGIKQFSLLDICFMLVLNDKYTWIARDSDGELHAFTEKPTKQNSHYCWMDKLGGVIQIGNDFTDGLFLSVRWRDRYPVLIPSKRELIERMIVLLGEDE